jgi:hypothetical protein
MIFLYTLLFIYSLYSTVFICTFYFCKKCLEPKKMTCFTASYVALACYEVEFMQSLQSELPQYYLPPYAYNGVIQLSVNAFYMHYCISLCVGLNVPAETESCVCTIIM